MVVEWKLVARNASLDKKEGTRILKLSYVIFFWLPAITGKLVSACLRITSPVNETESLL